MEKGKNIVGIEKKPPLMERIVAKLPSVSYNAYIKIIVGYIVLVAVMCAVRVITIKNSVEFPGFTGDRASYKLDDTIYTSVFTMLYFVVGAIAFIIPLFSGKIGYSLTKRSNPFVFISSLVGFCMVGCAGFFIYRVRLVSESMTNLDVWVIIFMLFTGSYLALDAVGFLSEKLKPVFSFGTIAFGISRLASEFINTHDKQYLSSNEYHLLSLALVLLFFSHNTRFLIHKENSFWLKFFGLFASFALLVYAVPELYLAISEPYYVDSVFIFCIVDLVLAIYILARLLSVKDVSLNNGGKPNE